jgi:hypothetical protein
VPNAASRSGSVPVGFAEAMRRSSKPICAPRAMFEALKKGSHCSSGSHFDAAVSSVENASPGLQR